MVYVKYDGRLGNQLFQLAAGTALATENNDKVVAPPSSFYKFINFTPTQDSFKQYSTHYTEPFFHYQKIPYAKDMLITGYFQSEKYFEPYSELIKDLFSIKKVYEDQIKEKYRDLLQEETIALHVRRTDYLHLNEFHPVQTLEYYKQALDHIDSKGKKVVIFSDDIEWCRTAFVGTKFVYIEKNLDIVDMFLMSYCSHNIIANSSFSWWGAYLNKSSNKKVVAPSNWFGPKLEYNAKDIYCNDWKVI
jgi:hypothetical protein